MRISVLGFGCGSVLGRVGRRASLRAMSAAWEAGIRLFDTARSYGFGEAEALLGEFLRGRREQAIVATKFGIAPRKLSVLKRAALPAARCAVQAPGVRKLVRRGAPRPAICGQFTAAGLQASLESSLRQLRSDYVDVMYLHEAAASAMGQTEVIVELESLIEAGKIRRAGLYAEAEVIAACVANGPATFSAMQFGANLFDPVAAGITESNPRGMLLIGNHPFGGEGRVAGVKAALEAISADESISGELRGKLRACDWQGVLEAIFGMALSGTKMHALVLSMMREEHLLANARAVASCRFTAAELALMRGRLLATRALEPDRP
jgi:aryl-alcohol dehydrogenase-like predicted oxidoreductase